jgi:hypothetical protein
VLGRGVRLQLDFRAYSVRKRRPSALWLLRHNKSDFSRLIRAVQQPRLMIFAPQDRGLALLADSPLIDAGGRIGTDCTPRNQIGQHRVEGDHCHDAGRICDVGAIEFQPSRKRSIH